MDLLDSMRIFVAVAEARGFAAAARRLRLSGPAVTRAVAALEQEVGARLLHRTTRTVRVSDAGERFLADAVRILADVEEARAAARGAQGGLHGPLLVTAPVMFGTMHVAPILLQFLGRHSNVFGRALFVDRLVDIVGERLDVAVRIAELDDSSLSAVRVGSIRRIVCASPMYLRKSRKLRQPRDLEKHDAIGFHDSIGEPDWSFAGIERGYDGPRCRLVVNNIRVAIDAAMAGAGVTRVPAYVAAEHVRSGALRIVLAEFEPPPLPVSVLYAEGRRSTARVRAFVDFTAVRLRKVLDEVDAALGGAGGS